MLPIHRNLVRVLPVLAAVSPAAVLAVPLVYGESAMVKVRPNTAPRTDTGVGLTGARNEVVSFQVVVNGNDKGAAGVTATFPGLTGPSGRVIGGADVSLYREAYLNISQPSFPDSTPGPWPDGLIPDVDEVAHEKRAAFPFDLPAQQSAAVWVDVHIPVDAPPGLYTGAVQLSAQGGWTRLVQVTLTVAAFTLPSTASLSSAFLLFNGNVCLAHTGDSQCGSNTALMNALLSRYAQMALEHRITLTNLWPSAGPGGDWTSFDAHAGPLMNGTTAARLPGAQATSLQYVGAVDPSSYAAFQTHLQGLGWLARAFDYTGDEPPGGTSFAAILSRAAAVKQGAPGLRTLVTTTVQSASNNGILGAVDILTPVVNFVNGDQAPYSGDQRPAYNGFLASDALGKVWMYQSCMSQGCGAGSTMPENTATSGWPTYLIDVAAARNRGMEWISFAEAVSGELYYETGLSLPTAWTNQSQYNGNGDGTLFYPGTPAAIGGSTDVPVASLRMKMIRLGQQDYEWLKRVADSGDPAFARAVALALVPSPWRVPDDGAAFDRAKLQLVSRLNQLMKVPAPAPAQGAPPAAPASNVGAAINQGTDPVTTYVPMPSGPGSTPGAPGGGVGRGADGGFARPVGTVVGGPRVSCGVASPGGLAPLALVLLLAGRLGALGRQRRSMRS